MLIHALLPHPPRTKLTLDKTRKSKHLWPGDGQCSQFKVNFAAASSLSPCALASYPGSGNTWTRYLLEAASGVFTGSIYKDYQLYLHGGCYIFFRFTSLVRTRACTHKHTHTHIFPSLYRNIYIYLGREEQMF